MFAVFERFQFLCLPFFHPHCLKKSLEFLIVVFQFSMILDCKKLDSQIDQSLMTDKPRLVDKMFRIQLELALEILVAQKLVVVVAEKRVAALAVFDDYDCEHVVQLYRSN